MERLRTNDLDEWLATASLDQLEGEIRNGLHQLRTVNLEVAVLCYSLTRYGRYLEAGYTSAADYARDTEDRLNLPQQTYSDYCRIGEIFTRYREKLEAAGFDPSKGLHKLRYLEIALERKKPAQVFKAISSMGLRAFREYATPKPEPVEPPALEHFVATSKDAIMVDGQPAIKIKDVQKIVDAGDVPYLIGVPNSGAKRVIQRALKEYYESR